MTTTALAIEALAEMVEVHTGCDPRYEPCFEGVTIGTCAHCHQVTAVTTLSLDGETFARTCVDCFIEQ